MTFRVAARTLLQLGTDLISSDAIAFYELIKNGFDAGSRRIEIEFMVRIPDSTWDNCEGAFIETLTANGNRREVLESLRQFLLNSVDVNAPECESLRAEFEQAENIKELRRAFERANRIVIRDFGSGMSLKILEDVYLTIGTTFRRKERANAAASGTPRLTVGEKGVGRLSAMRLGSQLLVLTTQIDDESWHELRIDWNRFSHDSDELIEDVSINPNEGSLKEDVKNHGTEIHIWGLRHAWSHSDVQKLAHEEFSRFLDPFAATQPIGIDVTYNHTRVPLPRFDHLLFAEAHAKVWIEFKASHNDPTHASPNLNGHIDYQLRNATKTISLSTYDLVSISRSTSMTLKSLGNFRLDLYWYNRGVLKAIEGIGDIKLVKKLLDQWGGGVAIYRDGFRVNPYGGQDDDWLDLDKDAFKSPQYKLNRKQIIAKLEISAMGNPQLIDQTNREGLQHNAQFLALRNLVKHILEDEVRTFLENADEKHRLASLPPIELMEKRTTDMYQKVDNALHQLKSSAPDAVTESGIVERVNQLMDQIKAVFKESRDRLAAHEDERERLVLLAGTGLLIEIIAHELHRATSQALALVVKATSDPSLAPARTTLGALGAQLRTLRTRLSVLDEVSVSGRQVKSTFDIINWIRDIITNHEAQFKRHNIEVELIVRPSSGPKELKVKMVRGMVVQILENLLSNSVYWLALQHREDPAFVPHIWVTIDTEDQQVIFTDNGPGINTFQAEDVFLPFVTNKPPGEGRGLGLYIAREIARYHNVTLKLSKEPVIRPGRLNTFVLSLRRVTE